MYVCDESTVQLTSVDMPVIGQVTQASPEKPILALILKLDMSAVREMISQDEFMPHEVCAGARGMAIGKNAPDLLSACIRLLDLLDSPRDISFLSNLIQRKLSTGFFARRSGSICALSPRWAIKATARPGRLPGSQCRNRG